MIEIVKAMNSYDEGHFPILPNNNDSLLGVFPSLPILRGRGSYISDKNTVHFSENKRNEKKNEKKEEERKES